MSLKPFDFYGYEGRRRVASFGWNFDMETQRLFQTVPIPDELLLVRHIAERFARMKSDE